jgi:competence protein ComFC
LRDALLAFKFRGRKDVGRFLVVLLKKKLQPLSSHIDIIVPLPGTQRRLRERGFSQTFLLSQEISRVMDRPVEYRSLIKSRETRDQYTLNRDERNKNLLGAFSVVNNQAVKGKRILLVDDLFTTGNTVYEASKMLKRAKAQRVEVFALARTP